MAWFRNYYTCDKCQRTWTDEWSCMCDDDCPHCGARHMSPDDSDDLTQVVEERDGAFVLMRSPNTAENHPAYEEVERFSTRQLAEVFLRR